MYMGENVGAVGHRAGRRPLARAGSRRPRGRKAILWFVAAHPERWSPELAAEQAAGAGKPGFLPALDALTDYPIRDRLDDIECPTLIVWGEKDLLVRSRTRTSSTS